MKEFRKNEYGFFICEECNQAFVLRRILTKHLNKKHTGQKEYFDKWLKEDGEGTCKICSEKTQFIGFARGYKKCCSDKCAKIQGNIISKIRYGIVRCNIKKAKETKKERYGNENYNNREKSKQTCLEIYGVENPNQTIFIHEKVLKSGYKLKQFKNTNIWYQGTYELDFIRKHYDKFPNIVRGPSIKYILNGENKVYHPDFYFIIKSYY